MGEKTGISWCDHTFNPWIGCHRISEACRACYAANETPVRVARSKGVELWGADAARQRTSTSNWNLPYKWDKAAKKDGVRRRVFCSSLADIFEDREDLKDWRYDLFTVISRTPNLDWLLLTKRPENIWPSLQDIANRGDREDELSQSGAVSDFTHCLAHDWIAHRIPPKNVWLGTTAENQRRAQERIPYLLEVPAAVHFVSAEPLLGPIRLRDIMLNDGDHLSNSFGHVASSSRLDWVIVGGESGNTPRPMHPEWVSDLRDECKAARTAFHMKQWGEFASYTHGHIDANTLTKYWETRVVVNIDGRILDEDKDDDRNASLMVRVGRQASGCEINRREYKEFPVPSFPYLTAA